MMQQYRQAKNGLPADALLLFRLGDFYEMFFEDARTGSSALGLTLTQRNGVPMCGVPFHSAQAYITKLVNAGHRVALCEQMEQPRPGQVVRREVTQILSPGSVIEPEALSSSKPNYLAAVYRWKERCGYALLDISTGDFRVGESESSDDALSEVAKMSPAEVVLSDADMGWVDAVRLGRPAIAHHEGWAFEHATAYGFLKDHFGTQSLDGFGCSGAKAGICAAGGLLHYLSNGLRRRVSHIRLLRLHSASPCMHLDETTIKTLDIAEVAGRPSGRDSTLLGVLDKTRTPMGARRLREWLLRPLRKKVAIEERLEAVAWMAGDGFPLEHLRGELGEVRDLERCLSRLAQGSTSGRDMVALKTSLERMPAIACVAQSEGAPSLVERAAELVKPLPEAVELIGRAISPDCPPHLREGGVIMDGYDPLLDELRSASTEGKNWVAALQTREQERTGIKSLKVRFNSVFGYYIEITKSNLSGVPGDYTRKQTTANGERFITPELKEMESKILGADEKAKAREAELFEVVRGELLRYTAEIQQTADAVATLDVLASHAEVARMHGYCRPEMLDEAAIKIEDGRHPVIERLPMDERFVPNDTVMDSASSRLVILTGPNMAGKSTYLRQVALIALMAHAGSFVPAAVARIGVLDRIFTRVGAQDDLSRGQSTFMVEMNETANILHNATSRSLVVLDEIGRGTSTFDGLSIAWAVAEHLHDTVKALTLFATHYHETSALSHKLSAAKLMNVAVREWGEQVIFLRKIAEGPADRSYGIQVARLAGLPATVLDRAKVLLNALEDEQISMEKLLPPRKGVKRQKNSADQPDLFAAWAPASGDSA